MDHWMKPPQQWNEAELEIEWTYRLHERIGIMCGDAEPTEQQYIIAVQEADAAIEEIKQQQQQEENQYERSRQTGATQVCGVGAS